jgi:aconitate hydratase
LYSDTLELDLGTVEPSLAGPRRPQDRVRLSDVKRSFLKELESMTATGRTGKARAVAYGLQSAGGTAAGLAVAETEVAEPEVAAVAAASELRHGSVVIAAITSCTNTSNPSVMMAAGLLAKKAVEKGLATRPWVKTSLAPGSKVVTEYYREAGLTPYLDQLGFNLVGYGCTTCIGNSGPLPAAISKTIEERDLVAVAVLSGNRNFEGRINSDVRANYLASPPLVVAYALAGRIDVDWQCEPVGTGRDGQPVFLRDLWPSRREVEETILKALHSEMFREQYRDVFAGDERWNSLEVPQGDTYHWDPQSTYVRLPPYFTNMPAEPPPLASTRRACSPCSATASPPITFRRRGRSRWPARRAST